MLKLRAIFNVQLRPQPRGSQQLQLFGKKIQRDSSAVGLIGWLFLRKMACDVRFQFGKILSNGFVHKLAIGLNSKKKKKVFSVRCAPYGDRVSAIPV